MMNWLVQKKLLRPEGVLSTFRAPGKRNKRQAANSDQQRSLVAHPLLHYAGGHLDRAGALRKDRAWLATQLTLPQTRLVPVWRNQNLIHGMEATAAAPVAVTMSMAASSHLLEVVAEVTFLGLDADTAVFAADLSLLGETDVAAMVSVGTFIDLRHAGPLLHPQDAALMAYARGILHWHRQNPFCGRCGHPSESRLGGHMRLCTNAACAREHFPRTDPAVIMLVEHRPAHGGPALCLLGRHSRFPARAFSTLAGFVDPGESLEEAVAREVFEEVGLAIHGITYQGSQPWPFPSSIMLGFRAQAASLAFSVDDDEIQEARWFTAEELRDAGDWRDERASIRLARSDSIARFLIDTWIEEVS